jgi:hypothetical protein
MIHPPGTGGPINALRLAWVTNWRVTLAFGLGLVLSAVSFFTTLDGLVSYTAPVPNDRGLGAWLLAGGATLGIQLVLLLSAWMVGTALVRAAQPHKTVATRLGSIGSAGLWFVMFFLTLFVSVAFSYHTFYNRITAYYTPEQVGQTSDEDGAGSTSVPRSTRSPHIENLANLHVRKTVEPLLSDMKQAAEDRRRWYLDAFTLPEEEARALARTRVQLPKDVEREYVAWNRYQENMRTLADYAKELVPALLVRDARQRDARETADANRREAAIKRAEELERAGRSVAAAEEEIKRLAAEIARVEAEIGELQALLRPIERRRDSASQTMACEETGSDLCVNVTGKSGRGPRWEAAKKDHDAAEIMVTEKEQMIAQAKDQLKDLKEQRAAADDIIAASKGIRAGFEQSAGTGPAVTGQAPISAQELEKLVDGMYRALDGLTEPATFGESASTNQASDIAESETMDSLRDACVSIHARVLIPALQPDFGTADVSEVAARAADIKCDRSGFEPAIERVQALNTGLREYSESGCESIGGEDAQKSTKEIIAHAERCLGLLDLDPQERNRNVQVLSELRREHSIAVHPFVPSKLGLFEYRDDLAWFSLFVASMIDLLVFFAGIVGGHESLRRIDRIGEELRGDEALMFGLASLKEERPTDSEKIRYWRRLLRHFVLRELSPATLAAVYPDLGLAVKQVGRSHIRYIGYIQEDRLLAGPDGGNAMLGTVQVWMCTPKSKIDLILRVPRDDDDPARPRPGPFDPLPALDEEPVRFYFLRELVLDIAEDIINWDRTHARYTDGPIPPFDYIHGQRVRRGSRDHQAKSEPRLTPEANHLGEAPDVGDQPTPTDHSDPNRKIHVRTPEAVE